MSAETIEVTRHVTEHIEISLEEFVEAVEKIQAGLDDPQWQFRTVRGLVEETGLPDYLVAHVLEDPVVIARKSVLTDREGQGLYTAADRPVTWQERLERFRTVLGRDF